MTLATVSGVSGDADKSLEISERALSEIATILTSAGLAREGGGPSAIEILRKVLEGADEARVRRAIRDIRRLQNFAGTDEWEFGVQTLCRFFLEISRNGPTAAAGVWHQLDWWRNKFVMVIPTRHPYATASRTAKPGNAL